MVGPLMRSIALLACLAAILVPSGQGTPPTPSATATVSGDARIGESLVLAVETSEWLDGKTLRLVHGPQAQVHGQATWVPGKGDREHQWTLRVIGAGFWRATLVVEHAGGSEALRCCLIAWSGQDEGDAMPLGRTFDFGRWTFDAAVTHIEATATPLNDTWVRLTASVRVDDPRLADATLETKVGQSKDNWTFQLPERGLGTSIYTRWTQAVPDPGDPKANPIVVGGMAACTGVSLDWTAERDVEMRLRDCPEWGSVPALAPALTLVALLAVVVLLRRRH